MLASSTVENYLKAIYKMQIRPTGEHEIVPMGQLATALGVVPGTATTMVRALADSGLATYEPYTGVKLTDAGERLAALVLRRHRLIELFLVKVLGMSWTEVHQEAEHLEHAVSDRLIERIDEMLGRPATDPHGDPIPNSEGVVVYGTQESLTNCPINQALVITRILDQAPEFLDFVEHNGLKPGARVVVESRDSAAETVRVRLDTHRTVTLGIRAATKVLVH